MMWVSSSMRGPSASGARILRVALGSGMLVGMRINASMLLGTIAAAFYPKPVIVRMSDFKTNEYAGLLGGRWFEPKEENPMLGLRGASRYTHPDYAGGFALECAALKRVREVMGLRNVTPMIPFCRRVQEGAAVVARMRELGLELVRRDLLEQFGVDRRGIPPLIGDVHLTLDAAQPPARLEPPLAHELLECGEVRLDLVAVPDPVLPAELGLVDVASHARLSPGDDAIRPAACPALGQGNRIRRA